jgi:hypothetical protein
MPLLVGFSRLYNGDHSMDQILYGWLLGLWLAFANHYLFREFIMQHIGNLLKQTVAYTKTQTSKFFWVSAIIFSISMALMMSVYMVVSANFDIPQEWKDRLLAKCDKSLAFMSFTNASLI